MILTASEINIDDMIITRDKLKNVTGSDYYCGNIIHKRFAYDFFRKRTLPIGNIVAFRAPMHVEAQGMIDKEDLITNDFIYSEDAINFVWEIPILDNAFGATCFQRLLNTQIAFLLSNKYINKPIEIDGDDIIVMNEFTGSDGSLQTKGKCSVSITYLNQRTTLGHTGINVNAGDKAPNFAYSTQLTDEQCQNFMSDVIDIFYGLVDEIFITTSKITL